MNQLVLFTGTAAMLGSALNCGIFFAFSSFVMGALGRLPTSEGVDAMQQINLVVINPSFMAAFMGTAVLSLGMGGAALSSWSEPSSRYFLAAAVCYLVGTFGVTAAGNVPLNDQLAAVSASDPGVGPLWARFQDRWILLNHVRTGAALAAAGLYFAGLLGLARA